MLQMDRRLQRIDAERTEALRCARRAEEVTEAGSRSALYGSTVYRTASGLGSPHGSSIGTARRHHNFLAPHQNASLLGLP
jgi:hypothetical protein